MRYIPDMGAPSPAKNQRVLHTRAAIVRAFVELVFERRYGAIRIADLVAAAGVGRATFYEHFGGKNDVLLTAMEPVLLALSTAASGRAARSYVKSMVSHLWDRRSTARTIFSLDTAPIIQRRLADMIRLQIDRAGRGLSSNGTENLHKPMPSRCEGEPALRGMAVIGGILPVRFWSAKQSIGQITDPLRILPRFFGWPA